MPSDNSQGAPQQPIGVISSRRSRTFFLLLGCALGAGAVVVVVALSAIGWFIRSSRNELYVPGARVLTGHKHEYCDYQAAIPNCQRGGIFDVAWSPDGTMLASRGTDFNIIVSDVELESRLHTLEGHRARVEQITWSPDSITLASSSEREVIVWNIQAGERLLTSPAQGTLAWSPDGTTLASSSDREIVLWDTRAGERLRTLLARGDFAWSPDGESIAAESRKSDKEIVVLDIETGEQLQMLQGHDTGIDGMAWSPTGTTLASFSSGQLIVWNPITSERLYDLPIGENVINIHAITWSSDGKQLAVISFEDTYEHSFSVWNVDSGEQAYKLRIPIRETVRSSGPTLSPDWRGLAKSYRGQVTIWNAESGQLWGILGGNTLPISGGTWSPDGETLATISRDNVILWDLGPQDSD